MVILFAVPCGSVEHMHAFKLHAHAMAEVSHLNLPSFNLYIKISYTSYLIAYYAACMFAVPENVENAFTELGYCIGAGAISKVGGPAPEIFLGAPSPTFGLCPPCTGHVPPDLYLRYCYFYRLIMSVA